MNYDHLLTRVWDKHEKKMYYEGAKGDGNLLKDYDCNECEFIAATGTGIIVDYCHDLRNGCLIDYFHIIPFGDRFIPMLCSGRKDQNKKLIYDCDILKLDPDFPSHVPPVGTSIHLVERGNDYPAFEISPLMFDDCNNFQYVLLEYKVEIIGNKFLNPDLLPKEQKV